MILKKLRRNKKGVSNIISIILITGIMITSVALTYSYIIPTIEQGNLRSSISTSSLFMTKVDNAMQTLFYDGIGSSRNLEVDAFSGSLEFRTLGLNVRAFIDDTMYLPIPGLEYGLARLEIPSDVAIMARNSIDYIRGGTNYPLAVTDEASINPAMITLERPEGDIYRIDLWYRLMLHIRDTGVGGTIDVSIVAIEFETIDSIAGLNEGTFSLILNKTSIEVNPARYGFVGDGQPITTSGDDFYITVNKNTGPRIIFSSTGFRSEVNFNLVVITLGINVIELA